MSVYDGPRVGGCGYMRLSENRGPHLSRGYYARPAEHLSYGSELELLTCKFNIKIPVGKWPLMDPRTLLQPNTTVFTRFQYLSMSMNNCYGHLCVSDW